MTGVAAPAVGFLGIGAMGLPMAQRIHAAGVEVVTADVSQAQVDRARALGLASTTDIRELADCSIVIVVVATGAQLMGLVSSELLAGAGRVRRVVVMSTIGAPAIARFRDAITERGIAVVDCPMTGGVTGAQSGRLTLFVSGEEVAVADVRPVLETMGTVEHCGETVGDGQSVKMVNQLLAASNLAVAAEAMQFARALGLDPALVLRLVSSGAGGSWMLSDRGPRMIQTAGEREVMTHLSIFAKDTELVLQTAYEADFHPRILGVVAREFQEATNLGLGRADDSSIIDLDPRKFHKETP